MAPALLTLMGLPHMKGGGMPKALGIAVLGMLVGTSLLVQGCTTLFGSGASDEQMAQERVDEPTITFKQPVDVSMTASRTTPSLRAELSARNATGLAKGSLTDVLFDFDRATLRTDALPLLEANARLLKKEGVTRLLLEGRGDEIGTVDYNLVLGERRAKMVKSYLRDMGLFADLRTTSYGKTRPLCVEYSEECWQRNRSVHFVIKE